MPPVQFLRSSSILAHRPFALLWARRVLGTLVVVLLWIRVFPALAKANRLVADEKIESP
jgi:hypothetical protein